MTDDNTETAAIRDLLERRCWFWNSRGDGLLSRCSPKSGLSHCEQSEPLRSMLKEKTVLLIFDHPFAAYAWKPLIAAYERNIEFEFQMVDPDQAGPYPMGYGSCC